MYLNRYTFIYRYIIPNNPMTNFLKHNNKLICTHLTFQYFSSNRLISNSLYFHIFRCSVRQARQFSKIPNIKPDGTSNISLENVSYVCCAVNQYTFKYNFDSSASISGLYAMLTFPFHKIGKHDSLLRT